MAEIDNEQKQARKELFEAVLTDRKKFEDMVTTWKFSKKAVLNENGQTLFSVIIHRNEGNKTPDDERNDCKDCELLLKAGFRLYSSDVNEAEELLRDDVLKVYSAKYGTLEKRIYRTRISKDFSFFKNNISDKEDDLLKLMKENNLLLRKIFLDQAKDRYKQAMDMMQIKTLFDDVMEYVGACTGSTATASLFEEAPQDRIEKNRLMRKFQEHLNSNSHLRE